MDLFILERTDQVSYEEYDSAVVCAENEVEARTLHPGTYDSKLYPNSWADDKNVICEHIGVARESLLKGLVLASFNAG